MTDDPYKGSCKHNKIEERWMKEEQKMLRMDRKPIRPIGYNKAIDLLGIATL